MNDLDDAYHDISLDSLDDDLLFIYLISKYPSLTQADQRRRYNKIDVHSIHEREFRHLTRFDYTDLCQLACLLQIPETFTVSRHRFSRIEGLFILCVRLAFPYRTETLSIFLGWSPTAISRASNYILLHIQANWQYLLHDFNSGHLTEERLTLYAQAISNKGAPLDKCWGFLDCTIRAISRPIQWQRELYNGHHREHSLKYAAVKCPDGLIRHLYGPIPGRRNDNHLLKQSQLLERCLEYAPEFYLYGDSAYGKYQVLLSPWSRIELSEAQFEFNLQMSRVRECVEWGFEDILRLWTSLTFTRSQKLFGTLVGAQFKVATLLTNLHICLYGCQTSRYFNLNPQSLEDYLKFGPKPTFQDLTLSE
ncbi:hypothetical protein BJ508DRAFT_212043 [Ascobolus immersus RN42]|uniref:DDE Tnp4 domain-containing protein n=1 Tax=Ascobolus immersus RN42 TaxID=1160509 RepID=A0A3N4I2F9_ASCIM|nr:hypothetical protein BJ508DRAFT_212043 [Ascobolus immersus RN42]